MRTNSIASKVLLDTQALVWWLLLPERLSALARVAIQESDEVFVSPVSIYEIDIKRSKSGALSRMPNNMPGSLPLLGLQFSDLTAEMAWRAASLPWIHKDPWDRLLVAQANVLDVPLVSADAELANYPVEILW